MNKKAVIDLGTNTFHLLIVEMKGKNEFIEIYRNRTYVKLAEEGIETIGKAAENRAFEALKFFSEQLHKFDCKNVKAYATAALRTASNGSDFIKKVKKEIGITIELIDGQKEARLIFEGAKRATAIGTDNQLIMDIGGGSTEFIIGNKAGLIWAESFPAGVGVLFNNFHKSEPISKSETTLLEDHLESILSPLFSAVKKHKPKGLIGAAGAFETMTDMMPCKKNTPYSTVFEMEFFPKLYARIINANFAQRLKLKGMPEMRAEMMPVAMVLIDFILRKTKIEQVFYSSYALKEGMIFED